MAKQNTTPKQSEIDWQHIKLVENGGKGLQLKYAYLYSFKGHNICKSNTPKTDVPPHDDLIQLIKNLRPIVAKVMGIDYARTLLNMEAFGATDMQHQLTEGIVQQEMKTIDVTGIAISTKKKQEGAVIFYDKHDDNEQVTAQVTAWINAEGAVYGIEEDLKEIIDDLKIEAYRYEYENKYVDFEQMAIEYPSDDEQIDEAEVVEDNTES